MSQVLRFHEGTKSSSDALGSLSSEAGHISKVRPFSGAPLLPIMADTALDDFDETSARKGLAPRDGSMSISRVCAPLRSNVTDQIRKLAAHQINIAGGWFAPTLPLPTCRFVGCRGTLARTLP